MLHLLMKLPRSLYTGCTVYLYHYGNIFSIWATYIIQVHCCTPINIALSARTGPELGQIWSAATRSGPELAQFWLLIRCQSVAWLKFKAISQSKFCLLKNDALFVQLSPLVFSRYPFEGVLFCHPVHSHMFSPFIYYFVNCNLSFLYINLSLRTICFDSVLFQSTQMTLKLN